VPGGLYKPGLFLAEQGIPYPFFPYFLPFLQTAPFYFSFLEVAVWLCRAGGFSPFKVLRWWLVPMYFLHGGPFPFLFSYCLETGKEKRTSVLTLPASRQL